MERAGFLNAMNNAAHQMITVGIWPSMETILGPSWRSTDSDDHNWDYFHTSGSALAREHISKINRIKPCKETADKASDPDQPDTPTRSDFDMERSKFGIGIRKLHKTMFDTLNGVRSKAMKRRALLFPLDDERRRMYIQAEKCKATKQLLPMTPRKHMKMSNTHWKSAVQNKFGHEQSSCAHIQGQPLRDLPPNLSQNTVNRFGHNLKNITKGGRRTTMHDNLQDLLSKLLRQVGITHDGGRFGRTRRCASTFSAEVNRGQPLPRNDDQGSQWLRGIIPDLIIHGTGLNEPRHRDPSGLTLPDEVTLVDFKTLGVESRAHHQASSQSRVNARQHVVTDEYTNHAKRLDQKYNGTPVGTRGPTEAKLREFNEGHVCAPTVGPAGEVSSHMEMLLDHIAGEAAYTHCGHYDVNIKEAHNLHLQRVRRKVCHNVHRGWAVVLEQSLQAHGPIFYASPAGTPQEDAEAEEQMDFDAHIFEHGVDGGDFTGHNSDPSRS